MTGYRPLVEGDPVNRSKRNVLARFLGIAACALFCAGCASFRAVNRPLAVADPSYGYRPANPEQHREPGQISLVLAFSGGGTRAAAFAYGVLEELRDTEIVIHGERRRLLDEVDTISGVSGGSFPAAYYGLFGDRIFEDFEERFLRRNIQGSLIRMILRPRILLSLLSPNMSRTILAAEYYHEHIFDRATFADLADARGPRIYINATDLSDGFRFTFTQGHFDLICSDLNVFPVAHAVAASSAVPMLLSPLTLENHAGECGLDRPGWLDAALASRKSDPRRYRAAREIEDYTDAKSKPFIHLVDGGISDNLGLRTSLDMLSLSGNARTLLELLGVEIPEHLAVIAVNAEKDPDPKIDLSSVAPSFPGLMHAISGSQIRRYNIETIQLARESVARAAVELSGPDRIVKPHFILVDFESFDDSAERDYFRLLRTSFSLDHDEIDQLREAGRTLLRNSPEFRALVDSLQ